MGARHALQIGVLLIGSLAVAVAADPPAPPTAERDRLRRRAEDLAGRGEAAAAVKAAEEALALDRAAFGANSAATADGLEVLARVRERNEQWAQAAAARREAARILAGLYGPADWRATDARVAAADTDPPAARPAAATPSRCSTGAPWPACWSGPAGTRRRPTCSGRSSRPGRRSPARTTRRPPRHTPSWPNWPSAPATRPTPSGTHPGHSRSGKRSSGKTTRPPPTASGSSPGSTSRRGTRRRPSRC